MGENIDNLYIAVTALGGLGLFLLGMIIMTDGLRALAGDAIRAALMRFTRSPLTGAITGAGSTAILQSSSATTVAAVGFVGAELMSFSAALGIIFGANIGTTITGWMVALLGFKLQLGSIVLPLIFLGAILKLFASGRIATWGYAMAGFGLIFVGITTMQEGMSGLQGIISFEQLPADTLSGRLVLVGIGIVFTLITQSSSAGVAAALTALFADVINFQQAAALVIGMDVGTTVTAAMATIGGSVGAKRTGFSHVIYNCFTGLGALMLISPYTWCWEAIAPGALTANAELALVAFHTTFNILGVILVLPLTHQFSRFIQAIIPEKELAYTQLLDQMLLEQPVLALNAVQSSINRELIALLHHVSVLLGSGDKSERINLHEMQQALDKTHAYIDDLHLKSGEGSEWQRLVAMIHTLDHMQRLHERCEEEEYRAETARKTPQLAEECQLLISAIQQVIQDISEKRWINADEHAKHATDQLHERVEAYRDSVVMRIGSGELTVPEGTICLEAIRWLRRVSTHISRVCQHMREASMAAGK